MGNSLLIEKYESAKQTNLLNKTKMAKIKSQIYCIDEIERKSTKINEIESSINDKKSKLEGKKSKISEKEAEIVEIQVKLSKPTEKSTASNSTGIETSHEDLTSDLDVLNSEIETLKIEKETLTTEIEALSNDQKIFISDKKVLTSKLTDSNVSKSDLENQLNPINQDLSNNDDELKKIRKEALHSNLSFVDDSEKTQKDIFDVDINKFNVDNPSVSSTIIIKLLKPHNMTDKSILINFKELGDYALKWIMVCPNWQHPRLMHLYDDFITHYDDYVINNDFTKAKDTASEPQAIVSKSDAGFYSYHPNKKIGSKFDKGSTLKLNETVTIIDNNIILDKNENYIKVKYIEGQNIKEQSLIESEGYIKTKNITFKGFTPDLLSTAQSSDDFVQNLSSTTTKLRSKTRKATTESSDTEEKSEYNLNVDATIFPNPVFMSDKEIYNKFVILNSTYGDCQKWIDSYLIHKRKLTNIHNIFLVDLKKSSTSNSQPHEPGGNSLSTIHPETLLAKISEKNANVYVKASGNQLKRVGNLNEGDYVKVEIDEDTSASAKANVKFKFINFEDKKYIPIVCLSEGKILYGYVNSEFLSFLLTDNESIIEKSSNSETLNSNHDDSLDIKILEDTIKKQDPLATKNDSKKNSKKNSKNIPSTPIDKELLKNPLFMSDKEIAGNIKLINDFEKVYAWAKFFPLQSKRIQEIYDMGDLSNESIDKLDTNKPKSIMATIIKNQTDVYLADGNKIKDSDASNNNAGKGKIQHFDSYGKLKKGGKVRLNLNESSNGIDDPVFVYHKDTALKNSRYVKIQFLDSNYLYTDGFISVTDISTYTVEQEMEEMLSAVISNNTMDDNLDFSLNSTSSLEYAEGVNDTFISGNPLLNEDGSVKTSDNVFFNKTEYAITSSSFGVASSLFGIAMSVKEYAQNFDVKTAINTELVGIMSSSSTLVSTTLGLAKNSISHENDQTKNLELAGNIFSYLSTGFDTLKLIYKKTPELLEMIKTREGPDLDTVMNDILDLLGSANSILGVLSDCSSTIPIVSSYISAISSTIKLLYDFVQFILYEKQIHKMMNTEKSLKSDYKMQGKKEERAKELQTLNGEIEKLQFKGSRITETENTTLKEKLSKRSEYMDLFITTELETINRKRKNRKIIKLTEDALNLTGDIFGIISVSVPEPNTIVAATLAKIGTKASAGILDFGVTIARGVKQHVRDKDKDNPNNTRNKQIRYGKVAAGMINNILTLPVPKPLPKKPTQEQQTQYDNELTLLNIRYTLVESHIAASGISVKDLSVCKGDVSQIFRIIYAGLLQRE